MKETDSSIVYKFVHGRVFRASGVKVTCEAELFFEEIFFWDTCDIQFSSLVQPIVFMCLKLYLCIYRYRVCFAKLIDPRGRNVIF